MTAILFKNADNDFDLIDPYYGGIWNFTKSETKTYLQILSVLDKANQNLNGLDRLAPQMLSYIKSEQIPTYTTYFPEVILHKIDDYDAGIIVPPEIILEVNRNCTYRCPWCYIPDMEQSAKLLTIEQIEEKIIYPFVLEGAKCWTITGGEPSVTPERSITIIKKIYDLTQKVWNKTPTIGLLSNGFNFARHANEYVKAGVTTVQFQLSSPIEKDDIELRNPRNNINSFSHVMEGIRKAKELGIYTSVNMVVATPNNIKAIDKMILLADSLDVDLLRITPVVTAGMAKRNEINLDIENYQIIKKLTDIGKDIVEKKNSRLKVYLPALDLENYRPMRCGLGFIDLYIDYSGKVYPCNNLIDEKLVCDPGNIKDCSPSQIWYKSKILSSFRNYKETNIGSECGICEYRSMCVGDCIARCWQQYGKFDLLKRPEKCFKDINKEL